MEKLDKDNIPSHIAITMDGNRRWARARGLPDFKGHQAGADNLERIVDAASGLGVKTLTVYALSTENLQERAKREIQGILSLFKDIYKTKFARMKKKGVRIAIVGERNGLPESIKKLIDKLKKTYLENESIKLNIALNYSGKKELVGVIKDIIKSGIELDKINEEMVERHLYTRGQKDPELVIRTGGRSRLSTFLLWQSAYSELYFSPKLCPDFSTEDLKEAITWYQEQQRNFGK